MTAVGIDLGTTHSVVAWVDEIGRAVVLPNRLGERLTPSVVRLHGGKVEVGTPAKELQAEGEPEVCAFFKRQMGVAGFVFPADGRDFTAVELSAHLLRALKTDAEVALGQPISSAVVTVPAYFRNPEREATLAAGKLAGLEVPRMINEPTAAAVAYGQRVSAGEKTLLVYDLGGGTFDVTLLHLDPEEIRILASDGDHELGGKDWDDRIVEFLAGRFEEQCGVDPLADRAGFGDLLIRAEQAKKRLSAAQQVTVTLVHGGVRGSFVLDRGNFEQITTDLLERTAALIHKVLDEQGVAPSAVDGVLLVGGSTRMPAVRALIHRIFGRPALEGVDVDEAVALGAAMVAAELSARPAAAPRHFSLSGRRKTVDVTNHSLGMIAINAQGTAYINSIIVPKNRPLPCREVRPFQHRTRRQGENELEVFVTQGEAESPADVAYLGRYVLSGCPPGERGLAVLEVEYCYDESGTVRVAGRVRGVGTSLEVKVEPLPADVPARFLRPPEPAKEQRPATAYLAFDLSGSMEGAPLAEARRAALGFLGNIDLSHCAVGLIAFADQVSVKLPACQDARRIERAITELQIGEVGICNGVHPFDEVLSRLASVDPPTFVITLTDGVWSNQAAAVRAARACQAQGIESIAIGFGGADRAFLKAIASSDEASFFTSLDRLVETFSTIAQVLTESQGVSLSAATNSGFGGALLARLRR